MADPHIITTLHVKRDELESLIAAYEKRIEAARFDLMHVNATLRLFEMNGEAEPFPVHMVLNRVLKRGEVARICLAALAEAKEGMDTRELAIAVMQADLANVAGVSHSTVRDFEKGRRDPIPNNLRAIQAALEARGIAFVNG
ncbi:MAG: helix-turn-helix transcriptional regulator, partial [Methylovirgula sp.]